MSVWVPNWLITSTYLVVPGSGGRSWIHFEVRIRVGDRRDHAAVSLLHWNTVPDRRTDRLERERRRRDIRIIRWVELVAQ